MWAGRVAVTKVCVLRGDKAMWRLGLVLSILVLWPVEALLANEATVEDVQRRIENRALNLKRKSAVLSDIKEAPKKDLRAIQPERRPRLYHQKNSDWGRLESVVNEQIQRGVALVKKFEGTSTIGALWLRLADSYLEKTRLVQDRLESEYVAALEKAQKTGRRPTLNLAPSYSSARKANQLYVWFIRDFPSHKSVPRALAQLAASYFYLQQHDKGLETYAKLAKVAPRSKYMLEADFNRAEHYFAEENYAHALKFYNRFIKKVPSGVKAKKRLAYHRRAWCYYRLRKVPPALKDLEWVLLSARQDKLPVASTQEVVRDLVWFYGEHPNGPRGARAYFSRVLGADYTKRIMPQVARQAWDTGRYNDAIFLYRDLISRAPKARVAAEYQRNIVRIYKGSKRHDREFRRELLLWVSNYSAKSPWGKANRGSAFATEVQKATELEFRKYIKRQHKSYITTGKQKGVGVLALFYKKYFELFPKSEHALELRFFYAELLFDTKKYAKAVENYRKVIAQGGGEYAKMARHNVLLALEKALPSDAALSRHLGKRKERLEFQPNIAAFVKEAELFVEQNTGSKEAEAVIYKVAYFYYLHNQHEKAIANYVKAIKTYPKAAAMPVAVTAVLDIYTQKKSPQSLNAVMQELLGVPEVLQNTKVVAQIKKVLSAVDFNVAANLEKSKDYLASAKQYERIAKESKDAKIRADALNNAAVNYERAKAWPKAVELYRRVARSNSPHLGDKKQVAREVLAAFYKRVGRYDKAAYWSEQCAASAKGQKRLDFLNDAAVIYGGLNNFQAAERNYAALLKYVTGAAKAKVNYSRAHMYRMAGNYEKAIPLMQAVADDPGGVPFHRVEMAYLLAQVFKQRSDRANLKKAYQKVVQVQKALGAQHSDVGAVYAAEARFELNLATYREFSAIPLRASDKDLAAKLKRRAELLNKLIAEMRQVVAYDNGSYVAAALSLMAEAEANMAQAILASGVPKVLKDKEKIKEYQQGLAKQAEPHSQKSQALYKEAVSKGFDLGARGPWFVKAVRRLSAIDKSSTYATDYAPSRELFVSETPIKQETENAATSSRNTLTSASGVLANKPRDLAALNSLAVYHLQKRQYALGELVLFRALRDHAGAAELYNNLAYIYVKTGRPQLAWQQWQKALSHSISHAPLAANVSAVLLDNFYYAKSKVLLSKAYTKDVVKDLQAKKPMAVVIANNYAVALAGHGKAAKARKIYELMVDTHGVESFESFFNYALVLMENEAKKSRTKIESLLGRLEFLARGGDKRDRLKKLKKRRVPASHDAEFDPSLGVLHSEGAADGI